MKTFSEAQHVHMIGIKGSGMTALAQILLSMGKTVSGSDTTEVFFTDQILQKLGIVVSESMGPENITSTTDWVVYSAAWDKHPETETARRKGLPVFNYPEMLGIISQTKKSIGISGTHGKTTTTALLSLAMIDLGLDPLAVVGSQVPQFGNTNAYTGKGDFFVAETCEYRRHFLNFHPSAIVITNIEEDHLDYFKDLEDIIQAFEEYVNKLPDQGILVACIDSPGVQKLLARLQRTDLQIVTYGESDQADYQLINHTVGTNQQSFQIKIKNACHAFEMLIPGKHNCLNATAVVAFCHTMGQSIPLLAENQILSTLQGTIRQFRSTTRRLERIGQYQNTLIFDDYGHHPTEIKASLVALRKFFPEHHLIVAFMPHTYTRTQSLMNDFAQAFEHADEVIINEIYASAREKPLPGVSGEALAQETSKYHAKARYLTKADTEAYITSLAVDPSIPTLFLTIGAGDNWKIGQNLLHHHE